MLFTNTQTTDCQHVRPTPPCCARAIVNTLLRIGYKPSDRSAVAYVQRLDLHIVASNDQGEVRS